MSDDATPSPRRPRRTNRGQTFPPEVLSRDEVSRLIAACSGGPIGIRNRALIAVLYRSGLRITETLALLLKDIDLDGGAIRVLHGKGNRSRTVGIDAAACAMVGQWIAVRASLGVPRNSTLFCMADGRRLESSYVRVMLPRLGRRAGIEKRVHAHGLRHTHAAELRTECVDIGIISKQLGHRSIATTARYLDHVAPLAVVEAMRARAWQAR